MTYNGLEACLINSSSYDDDGGISATTGADGCVTTDSLDDEVSSCSSSKDVCGSSFSSHCLKQDEEHSLCELGTPSSVHLLPLKGKKPITYTLSASDIENMKEKFAKLLLGDDSSGGARGVCTALALSNAITNLSGILSSMLKLKVIHVTSMFVYVSFIMTQRTTLSWQPLFLENFGSSNHCVKRKKSGGGRKWTGCCLRQLIWLSWFQQNKVGQMDAHLR
jgi:hypothetical protein